MDNSKERSELTVSIDELLPDEGQIRKHFSNEAIEALAISIEQHGIINPLIVVELNNGKYKIIDGERRFRACKLIAEREPDNEVIKNIKVSVYDKNIQIAGILANIARIEYNPVEYAEALYQLKVSLGENFKQGMLCALTGKSKTNVSEYLSLLKLPDSIKTDAKNNNIVPFRELKMLAASSDNTEQKIECYNDLKTRYLPSKEDMPQSPQESVVGHKKDKGILIIQKRLSSASKAINRIAKDISKTIPSDRKEKDSLVDALDKLIEEVEEVKKKIRAQEDG